MKTSTDRTDGAQSIRDAAVVTWRRKQLLDAGFDLQSSEILARECGIELHALLDLVERGLPAPACRADSRPCGRRVETLLSVTRRRGA